ncbi:uncharacterized small protein (DUF1192 family) [Leifsonia sp. AK011]|uniref:DUF4349 domain-containing protein n=1 Tax=Leifsonia sp. AK011 TaxID=2723075 RepID=UPI00181AD90C|nr:DUF4349 domain-containing protein [Leifsonia sp. AK011]NYF09985.1 uncharacterized small protein (DUF1192 family) [Leifsonia sp. AK011]
MRRILILPTALVLATLALSGCTAGSSSDMGVRDAGSGANPEKMSEEGAALDTAANPEASADREVIVTGWLTVTVEDPLEASSEAIKIAESVGGRVDGRDETAPTEGDRGRATLTLRLPADDLTETLDKLKALGEVQELSLTSNDVTMATQDLDARISALSASIDRLEALLTTATDTDNLIALETAISDRQAQLESMEAERRYYADQVSLSTVTLNLVSVADAPVQEPITFLDGLAAGWNAFVGFFAGLVVVFGVLLPWIVFAALITGVVLFIVRWRKRAKARTADAAAGASTPVES